VEGRCSVDEDNRPAVVDGREGVVDAVGPGSSRDVNVVYAGLEQLLGPVAPPCRE
jgi:hypothetical protein